MSSSERISGRRLLVLLGLSAALLAGGCNVQPLYGTAAVGTGGTTATALADVDVAPIEGRVGQKIRNDLLFDMNGGNDNGGGYVVDLRVREQYTNVVTRAITGLPGGRNIRLVVSYSLKKAGSDEILTSGTVTRISSIDYFNQRFANDRATINAEDRAAEEVAADIHLRLAAYFATGKNFVPVETTEPTPQDLPTFNDTIFDDEENNYGAPEP